MILISGLSGSGKSVALKALEDQGFYCVDNLPAGLLPALADEVGSAPDRYPRIAVGIDARAGRAELKRLPALIGALPLSTDLIFLTAENPVLIQRFSETRRRHPLGSERTLTQAIDEERALLEPLIDRARFVIDTSQLNIHQLRRRIWDLVHPAESLEISNLVLESFAFKHGVPREIDLLFDARCLPNPHWQDHLREATGLERPVREYLAGETMVHSFIDDIDQFLRRWLPAWADEQRSHMTIAVGCTGGQHRSVYVIDELAARWRKRGVRALTHHRELHG